MARRLLLYLGPLILAIMIIFFGFFYTQSRLTLQGELQAEGKLLARNFSSQCQEGMSSRDASRLEIPLRGLAKENEVSFLGVYDLKGELLASYKREELKEINLALPPGLLSLLEKGETLALPGKIYDFYAPVKVASGGGEGLGEAAEEQEIGYVRVGLSTQRMCARLGRSLRSGILFGVLMILAAAVLLMALAMQITRPMKIVSKAMKEIGEGDADLTRRIEFKSEDELGEFVRGFNSFTAGLAHLIKEITQVSPKLDQEAQELAATAQELTAASQEVTATIQGVSQSSSKQMEALKQTAEGSQRAQRIARETVEAATQAEGSADKIFQLASSGISEAQSATKKIEFILTAIHSLIARIDSFAVESKRITEILATINEVAQKTNLLAVNAAIEASHAGEAGRGFSVIATEVRHLSEKSQVRAEEIKHIIDGLTKRVQEMVKVGRETAQGIQDSKEVLLRSAQGLEEISGEITGATHTMEGIVEKGADNQRTINTLVEVLDRVAREAESNSAAAQEVSAGMEEQAASFAQLSETTQTLAGLANQLRKLIGRFRL